MIGLRRIKRRCRRDLGHDLALERLVLDERGLGIFGDLLLLRVGVKDRGAVLRAMVAELSVHLRGVNVMPEHVHELRITYLGGVVFHLHDLGVAGAPARDLLVGRVLRMTAHIAGHGCHDARHGVVGLFHAPEAPARKRRLGGGGLALRRGKQRGAQRNHDEPRECTSSNHCSTPCHVRFSASEFGERP